MQQKATIKRDRVSGFWFMGVLTLGLVLAAGPSSGQTVWNSASDGAWSNGVSWTAGVPDFNPAFITNTAGTYAVSIGPDVSATFSDLTLANAGANTTTVEIAEGALIGSNGVLRVNAGSRLLLKTGGTFLYDTASARASDFATVAGVLRIEGGLFWSGRTNAAVRADTRFLTIPSGGLFEMTNGTVNLLSATYGGLYVNGGTFRMSGGTMMLVDTNENGSGSFRLDNSGYARLDGTAKLVTSNAFVLDSSANTTTRLEVAGADASFAFASVNNGGRPALNASGYTAIDVRQGRLTVGVTTDFTEANFNPNASGGTIAVNVWEGGYVTFKQVVMARGKSSGMSQINVYGGTFAMPGAGTLSVGRDAFKAGVIAQVNVTNGVFDMSDTAKNWGMNKGAPAIAVGWTYDGGSSYKPWGEINLSGGVISNAGACVLGVNRATRGDFLQTGGVLRQGCGRENLATNNPNGTFVVGFSSGKGNCTVSNGFFGTVRDVYVGGVDAKARWNLISIYVSGTYGDTNNALGSVGTFTVAGGSVVISNTVADKIARLHVGDYGTGTVSIAESGALYAQAVDLHASPDGSRGSTLRFTFGPQGVGTMACDSLTIGSGAKLVVNADAYTGTASAVRLVAYASKTGDFAEGDVTITGTRKWELRATATGLWLRRNSGSVMMFN